MVHIHHVYVYTHRYYEANSRLFRTRCDSVAVVYNFCLTLHYNQKGRSRSTKPSQLLMLDAFKIVGVDVTHSAFNNTERIYDKAHMTDDPVVSNGACTSIKNEGSNNANNNNNKYLINDIDEPCVYYDPEFLSPNQADVFYQDLLRNTKWEKTVKINRWVSLYHELWKNSTNGKDDEDDENDENNGNKNDASLNYKYRDAPGGAIVGFTDTIRSIQNLAQDWYKRETGRTVLFNVCLLNFYENGEQAIGWHSDREEIGRTTPIASISLGTPRKFHLRAKENGVHDRATIELQNGSLVVMENICQDKYLHCIPRQSDIVSGRINLTYRCKDEGLTTAGEQEHDIRDNFLDNITAGATPSSVPWSESLKGGGVGASSTVTHRGDGSVFGDNVVCGDTLSDDEKNIFVIHFLAKTNLGSERYCGAEMQELVHSASMLWDDDAEGVDEAPRVWKVIAKPYGLDGFVGLTTTTNSSSPQSQSSKTLSKDIQDRVGSALLKMRSVHHILLYHIHFNLGECTTAECPTPELVDGDTLYRYFKLLLVDKKVTLSSLEELTEGTFRASCDRIGGPHAFHYPEVEAEMGGAISEYYDPLIKPKMTDYDVCIRCDVVGNWVVVGTQLNVDDLSKDRHFLKFRNAVTIKTNLAYDMVRLARITKGDFVVDPFCGSGTLLLEALEVYQKRICCLGLDVSRRSADGATENALAEGYGSDVCKFICADVRSMRRHVNDEQVNAIITNMPWGVRTGDKNVTDLKTMYEIFLRTSWYVLKPGARMVLLVLRGLQMSRIVRKLSGRYRLLSINVIR